MTELAISIGVGLLTNTIYDIAKYTGARFVNRSKTKDKDLRGIIEKRIIDSFPNTLEHLLESSTYATYLNSPQFLDIVNSYLEYKTICNYSCTNVKIKKHIKKDGLICADDVIEYISDNVHELYLKNGVLTVPSKDEIRHATSYILNITEEVVAQNLSPETSQMIYFLNSRADINHEEIILMLVSLQRTINQIQEKQLSPTDRDYEEIRSKYHAILKEKNSDAHIYLLDKFPFEKFYVPPVLQSTPIDQADMSYRRYAPSFTPWKDIFVRRNIVYITGGAGYGKSLFTKKIINNYSDLNLFHSNEYLVICGELKSFYPNGADSAISVIEFLRESIKSSTLMDVPCDFIEHYLNAGRCIILLDALDEVEKTKRVTLHESVVAFFKTQNPNNKICITSRDRGFIPERNVEVFKICPLREDQIEKYVDKIIALKKFEKADKEAFMKQSRVLVQKGFLNSFLVLSLLINIYKAERELPENKLELYQKCFEYIANKREKDKTQKEFDWKVISPIMKDNTFIELSRLALPNNSNIDRTDVKNKLLQVYKTKYSSEVDAENAIDEFLKFCSDRTELFVPTAEDKFKFFHRSFFEYFYSLYIFLRCNNEEDMLAELLKFDVDSEVFELTVAMLKQKSEAKYQALIEKMFDRAVVELSDAENECSVFNILILSMQVIDDALFRKQFLDIVINKKSILLRKDNHIHNLRLISTIYDNDTEVYQKICDAYKDECLMYLFDSCENTIAMNEEYSREYGVNLWDQILDKKVRQQNRIHIIYRYTEVGSAFYVPILSKAWDCKKVVLETQDDTLLKVYKKFSPRNYRKRSARTRAAIEKFRNFSEQDQQQLIKLMLTRPDFIRM